MKTTFNNIEGDIKLSNEFADELFEKERETVNKIFEEYMNFEKIQSFDELFSQKGLEKLEEEDKAKKITWEFLEKEFSIKGWCRNSNNNDLAQSSYVGKNLIFVFKPERDIGFDTTGGICTNVFGVVEITLK